MDETPKIQKVSEVFRTTEEQVTNAYLAAGWMLLAVMTGHDEHDSRYMFSDGQMPIKPSIRAMNTRVQTFS